MSAYKKTRTVKGWPVWLMLAALSTFLCISISSFAAPAGAQPSAPAAGVKDISGYWAAPEIEQALAAGYAEGYPDGTFRPGAGVTRAEFVAMADNAFRVASAPGGSVLNDVHKRDWFAGYVRSAIAAGFVSGYPDGTFRPQQKVSREEAACMLAKLLQQGAADSLGAGGGSDAGGGTVAGGNPSAGGSPGTGDSLNFADAGQIDTWAAPFVARLVASGVTAGYPSGNFMPKRIISRAEATVMIGKAMASLLAESSRDNAGALDVQVAQDGSGTKIDIKGNQSSSRDNAGVLDVQVAQDGSGTKIDIKGNQSASPQLTEESNPQRLEVTMPGITVISTPSEIDVGKGGLDKIVTTPPDATGVAKVEISFDPLPVPLVYNTAQGQPGELLITVPPQIYKIEAGPVSDFMAVNIWGTAPLNFQASTSSQPSPETAFDFANFTLSSSLQSWQEKFNVLGITGLSISQYQPDDVRLVAAGALNLDPSSDSGNGGCQLVLRLQSPSDNSQGAVWQESGSAFYGIDTCVYPGDAAMQTWWNDSPFYYTGFYLAPAPDHTDTSWMNKRQILVNQGWGLLPVYLGCQAYSPVLNTASGTGDADDAASLAASAGFPDLTTVFLDIETSHPLTGRYLSYVSAWVNEIRIRGYKAGVYCNTDNANQIYSALPGNVEFWVAHYNGSGPSTPVPSPAQSGIYFAGAWQFTGDCSLSYGGCALTVDLDTSIYTDLSTSSTQKNK